MQCVYVNARTSCWCESYSQLINKPPVVNAGQDVKIALPDNIVNLNGSVTDDGLPSGILESTWEVVSGDGQVTFGDIHQPVTTATFSEVGHYVLRLTATDTQLTSSDEMNVDVYAFYKVYTTDADFNEGQGINISNKTPNELQLSDEVQGLNYVWVAVSTKGTVVKINTDTGIIEGEYYTSPDGQPKDPSRTTVDLNGDVWVANRAGNSVVRIGLKESGQWIDKNENDVCDTSTGYGDIKPWTNAGEADTNGGVSTAQDECIINYTRVSSSGTRHVSVNKDNDVWVSGTNERKFDLIDGKTGEIKRTEPSVGYGGYGGLIDGNGVIWSARPLLRWDTALPLTGPNSGNWKGYDHDSYGLAIDPYGNVWNTSYSGNRIYKFAPNGNLIGTYQHGYDLAQGCVADKNGDIWVAHSKDGGTTVGHLKNDGTFVGNVAVGNGPTGVAVDAKGRIWVTNYNSRNVMRINPTLGPIGEDGVTLVGEVDLTTVDIGGNPYNYSDMTGSTLKGIPQKGSWTVIFDSKKAGTQWGTIAWNGTIFNDSTIRTSISTSEDGITFTSQQQVTNRSSFTALNGRFIKIIVTLIRSEDGRSPILTDLTVGINQYKLPEQDNLAPTVNTGEDTSVIVDKTLLLNGLVTDDCLPSDLPLVISWSKVSGVGNVEFNQADKAVTNVKFSEVGEYLLRLTASDSLLENSDEVKINVLPVPPVNKPPVVNAGEDQTITLPENTVNLNGSATDDGLPSGILNITWETVSGSGDVIFGNINEPITTASFSKEGEYVLRLTASDTELQSSDEVKINVLPEPDLEKPIVQVTIDQTVVNVNNPVTIKVSSTDNVGVVSQSLFVNDTIVEMDESGKAIYSSQIPGLFKVTAEALDAAGNEGYWQGEFNVLEPGDTIPPIVEIISPVELEKVNRTVSIIGTASDENLIYYKIEYSVKDKNLFIEFSSGTTSVVNGELGIFDATLLENGLYDIKVTAVDKSGNISYIITSYEVYGNEKVGYFTMSFEDMVIPFSGIPVYIGRTYDSRNKALGAFGIGWTLSLSNLKLTESYFPGRFWRQYSSGSVIKYYYLEETKHHKVVVTYPDGTVDEFKMVVFPSSNPIVPIESVDVSYTPLEGTFSTLESLDNNTCFVEGSDSVELVDSDFNLYNPNRYKLTTKEGIVYIINQATGLESITDRNNNTITFTSSGITHSDGKGATFIRDNKERITAITDLKGNSINYEYDYYGDLVDVTDREGNKTNFTYNNNHGLIDVYDPRGIKAMRNEYDENGRLIASVDTLGNRVEYTHDIGSKQEIVKDRLGNITVFDYDDNGNVLKKTDPLGNVRTYSYDSNDNMLTETNPLGYTTVYTYDSQNNMLTKTDPLGNVIEKTYNSRGQILTVRDGNGNVSSTTYDSNGNVVSTTDNKGNVTSYTYDTKGNITSMTDSLGNTTNYVLDSFGNNISVTDSEGNITQYTYDANGNQLSNSNTRIVDGVLENIITTYEYDSNNKLIKTIDSIGNSSKIEYNSIGKEAAVIDKKGNGTTLEYDELGRLSKKYFPDVFFEEYQYDADGRRTKLIDAEGRTTTYEYDKAGRLVKTTFADGSFIIKEYDEAGQVIKETNELGNAKTSSYDEAGRIKSVTDSLGFIITYDYDNNGNVVKIIDQNSNETEYKYDENNRVIKKIYADGTFTTSEYDSRGFNISETNQLGNKTIYEYSDKGRVETVIDALNNATLYAYDEQGNMISIADASNHTTNMQYDKLGRLIKRTLPMGQYEMFSYDEAGNEISHRDFNGNIIEKEYDVMNRVSKIIYPDGSEKIFNYTASSKVSKVSNSSNNSGTISYEYDLRNRLTRKTDVYGRILEYSYDAVGNKTSINVLSGKTEYYYDSLNRLLSVKDPEGDVTSYGYDKVGNRINAKIPNGIMCEYGYDSLNRINLINQKNLLGEVLPSYIYERDLAGKITKEIENNERTAEYTYDAANKLLVEKATTATPSIDSTGYSYDAVGNRLSEDNNSVIRNYTYDNNNRMLSDGISDYSYDDNGNTISKTNSEETINYSYDYDNRLIKIVTVNGSETIIVEYSYDAEGIRTEKSINGVKVRYTVDTNQSYHKVVEERTENEDLIASYVYGINLISQKRGTEKVFYNLDGHGSTRFLSDNTGSIKDTYVYDAFGQITQNTGTTINDFLYRTEQYDEENKLYYLRARYMNPAIGRFMTMDDYRGNEYDPLTLHRYLYANENPVNMYDPSGRFLLYEQTMVAAIFVGLSLSSVSPLPMLNYLTIYRPQSFGQKAQNDAKPYVEKSLKLLYGIKLNLEYELYYKKYFGTVSEANYNYVIGGFEKIRDAINKPIKYHYSISDPNTIAYSYVGGNLDIWLEELFFIIPDEGRMSKMGTIIHEVSHIVHYTNKESLLPKSHPDYQEELYGDYYVYYLANNASYTARRNASNYEYFAEDIEGYSPNIFWYEPIDEI